MPLLAPLFLLGLAAVAVPLLVHLVRKEKHEPTAFPSMMFLEQTPAPFTARRNLRDPLLLALRILALMALVLAFARPVFGRRAGIGGVDQRRREIVVLLDRSFSMRIGTRWAAARSAVDSVIRTIGRGDHMTLVAFDRRAQAVTDATGDKGALRAALDSVALTDESTRLTPAVTMTQQRLAVSDAPRKVVVIVSDFQRTAWDLADDVRLPAGTEVVGVDVAGPGRVSDRSVRSVDVREDRRRGAAAMIVTARIANAGAAARAVPVRLEVGGRVMETRTTDLPEDGGAAVTFAGIPVPPTAVAARVVIDADAVPGDDAFHFLVSQTPALRAVVVESRPTPYVTRALSIGETPRIEVVARTPAAVTPADLTGTQLIVLADGAMPSGIGAARLSQFVRGGGGVLLALGDAMTARAWQGEARPLLAGEMPAVRDADGATIGALDERHPVLSMFAGERSGDLSTARFLRYRAIDASTGVLARFDDGSAAITEHALGSGRVITFGSSLDGSWNDLPRQPAFLPLMQQLAQYAANWHAPVRALALGSSVRPADLAGADSRVERWVSTAPSGARTTVGGADAPVALELREAGVHALRPGGQPGAKPLLVAANITPAELDFAAFDVTRLRAALSAPTAAVPQAAMPLEESAADREARQRTWWYLLLAVVLLLAAESVVARRASMTTAVLE